jgi:hypothetical protein
MAWSFLNIQVTIIVISTLFHMGPCHHGIAKSRVAFGGDGIQTLTVAKNVLNKQT